MSEAYFKAELVRRKLSGDKYIDLQLFQYDEQYIRPDLLCNPDVLRSWTKQLDGAKADFKKQNPSEQTWTDGQKLWYHNYMWTTLEPDPERQYRDYAAWVKVTNNTSVASYVEEIQLRLKPYPSTWDPKEQKYKAVEMIDAVPDPKVSEAMRYIQTENMKVTVIWEGSQSVTGFVRVPKNSDFQTYHIRLSNRIYITQGQTEYFRIITEWVNDDYTGTMIPWYEAYPEKLKELVAKNYRYGFAMIWDTEDTCKVPMGGVGPEPIDPDPKNFNLDVVQLYTQGGPKAWEGALDRTLFTDAELDPTIYGPIDGTQQGGYRPWLKITNPHPTKQKQLHDLKLSVIQGNASNPDYDTEHTDDAVLMYEGYKHVHPTKIYTPYDTIPNARLTLRLKDDPSYQATIEISPTLYDKYKKEEECGASYWMYRPSDAEGNLYPDHTDPDKVPRYTLTLNKDLVFEPGETRYFECVCEWLAPLPETDIPDFPIPAGYTARWGYVLQWYPINSCSAALYPVGGLNPPVPEPLKGTEFTSILGRRNSDNEWINGLGRLLVNSPVWELGGLKPRIRFVNNLGRGAWFKDFILYVTNGYTGTQVGVQFKDEVGNKITAPWSAKLDAIIGEESPISVTATLPYVGEDFHPNTEQDKSYWSPRTSDENGNAIPGETPTPGEESSNPHTIFEFPEAIYIEAGEEIEVKFFCHWEAPNQGSRGVGAGTAGVTHCLQWYPGYYADTTNRIYMRLTWDASDEGWTPEPEYTFEHYTAEEVEHPISNIPIPSPRPDYEFVGWDPDPTQVEGVYQDMTFKAKWLKVSGGNAHIYVDRTDVWYQSMNAKKYNAETRQWEDISKLKQYRNDEWVDYPESEP